MQLLEERNKLLELKKELKVFSKAEIAEKFSTEQITDVNLNLQLAFNYIDEAVKAISNTELALYLANLALENNKMKWQNLIKQLKWNKGEDLEKTK